MTSILEPALAEIDGALNKLEAAIDEKAKASRSIAELRAELLIARDDVTRLKRDRESLREENLTLSSLGEKSAVKLDEAIAMIQGLLIQIEAKQKGDR